MYAFGGGPFLSLNAVERRFEAGDCWKLHCYY